MARKRPSGQKAAAANINLELDKNERFVLRQCIGYLLRHLELRLVFDPETLAMICWALGFEMVAVGHYLIDRLDPDRRDECREALEEHRYDPNWYARTLVEMLQKGGIDSFGRFRRFVVEALRHRREQLEYEGVSDLEANIANVRKMFNLTEEEAALCTFLFIIASYDEPEEFFDTHLHCDRYAGRKYLINVLGLSEAELNRILNGTLVQVGLLSVDSYCIGIERGFIPFFQNPADRSFAQDLYAPLTQGSVSLEDFLVESDTLAHLKRLLQSAADSPTHILFYGPPGTGKSSLAHALAAAVDLPAFEILRGKENTAEQRRMGLVAGINLILATEPGLIVVDEADNLLNTRFSWLMRGETQDQGWLNQILEKPDVRIIWITNSTTGIEPSVLRRFAFSLAFKPFNRRQRALLWERIARRKKVKRFFTARHIETYARRYEISAGAIDTAVQKAADINPAGGRDFHRALAMNLEAYRTLQSHGQVPLERDRLERHYSIDGLNVSTDVEALLEQVKGFDRFLRVSKTQEAVCMNLLFFGPPGTGKSALARYIAAELDLELHVKRVSDLHSKWVGETEQNIRDAFCKAEAEQAVLVIDEADSLLFSRDRATTSWELSFTNEFLARMENYRGILICTTNRVKDLDAASLRRFVHKLRFGHLDPDGNVIFYRKLLAGLAAGPLPAAAVRRLRALRGLAPGDFRTVKTQFRFYPGREMTHAMLVQALEQEASLKKDHAGKRVVGF